MAATSGLGRWVRAPPNPPYDAQGPAQLVDKIEDALRRHLPACQAGSRQNPFHDPVREVQVATHTGKILRMLTNDLDAPAQEIADLYKRRWAIELFFRWVKQNLKIRQFLGASENAVRIQIAVAIACLYPVPHRRRQRFGCR